MPIVVLTPAKLNLFLEVLGKRSDGYHEIRTLMQTVTWFDRLSIEATEEADSLTVSGPAADSIPDDARNLVLRAAKLLRDRTGTSRGARVTLEKSIPPGAGLGGGSSNAAATLSVLNQLWETGLSKPELEEIAAEIGSDVPFFLTGGRALAEGRGEIIQVLPQTSSNDYFVLLAPPILMSTAEVYKKLQRDLTSPLKSDRVKELCSGNKQRSVKPQTNELSRLFGHNDLQNAAFQLSPELAGIWQSFDNLDFSVKGMSGSGSCLFGICETHREAASKAKALRSADIGYVAVVQALTAPFLTISAAGN
ncbi:MAG: 4-(cytidine 5'-diphospho)-2-C-methyl-D-erythritol kinase [Planctomycetota bacterium]|jgi:4-diphosphocytidyl-2-C-methyl-D-erythritol kinase